MSYVNALGEFIVNRESDEWPKTIRYVERRPVHTRGLMNPWEQERKRALWQQEQDVWSKIVPLKAEYVKIEQQMATDISIFNSHLAELERIAKKKTGLGPIGTYGGMALTILPGFGWAKAVFSAFSMIFEMIGANKKKKRVNELMRIMESAEARLQVGKQRLLSIQEELSVLIGVTERVKTEQAVVVQQDIRQSQERAEAKRQKELALTARRDVEIQRIRQSAPNRVVYQPNEL
jgi:hypothetical protein